jgi:outer membrane immunogenic protein
VQVKHRLGKRLSLPRAEPLKKIVLAGIAASALMSVPALSAPPAAYNWTGCYIGASAGGMWGNAAIDHSFAATPTNIHTDPSGFIGGGQIGCDYRNPSNWLFGLQGEFNWTGAQHSQTIFPPFPYVSETFDVRVDWYASATARLGYVSGPWLIYGKGGAAWVKDQLRNFAQLASSSFDFSANTTRSGWTISGGLEYAFAPNWSATFEYGYYDFGNKPITLSGPNLGPGPGPTSDSYTLHQNFSVVKVGLNYRFATGH